MFTLLRLVGPSVLYVCALVMALALTLVTQQELPALVAALPGDGFSYEALLPQPTADNVEGRRLVVLAMVAWLAMHVIKIRLLMSPPKGRARAFGYFLAGALHLLMLAFLCTNPDSPELYDLVVELADDIRWILTDGEIVDERSWAVSLVVVPLAILLLLLFILPAAQVLLNTTAASIELGRRRRLSSELHAPVRRVSTRHLLLFVGVCIGAAASPQLFGLLGLFFGGITALALLMLNHFKHPVRQERYVVFMLAQLAWYVLLFADRDLTPLQNLEVDWLRYSVFASGGALLLMYACDRWPLRGLAKRVSTRSVATLTNWLGPNGWLVWVSALVAVIPFVGQLLVVARYIVEQSLLRAPVLYLRSFTMGRDRLAFFGKVIVPALSNHAVIVCLTHDAQLGSTLALHAAPSSRVSFQSVGDGLWQRWIDQELRKASAVVIDVSKWSDSLQWEIDMATSEFRSCPERLCFVTSRKGRCGPLPRGAHVIEAGSTDDATARKEVRAWYRRVVR